jgi:hypothetical protein
LADGFFFFLSIFSSQQISGFYLFLLVVFYDFSGYEIGQSESPKIAVFIN